MENEYKQPSKFQRDWQGHYPLILIYLTLVIACVIVGKETNWQFFGFMMYALLAVGILYLLCFLPWYFISLKEISGVEAWIVISIRLESSIFTAEAFP